MDACAHVLEHSIGNWSTCDQLHDRYNIVAFWSITDGIVHVGNNSTYIRLRRVRWMYMEGYLMDVWPVSKPTQYDASISDVGNYLESYCRNSMRKEQEQNQFECI